MHIPAEKIFANFANFQDIYRGCTQQYTLDGTSGHHVYVHASMFMGGGGKLDSIRESNMNSKHCVTQVQDQTLDY